MGGGAGRGRPESIARRGPSRHTERRSPLQAGQTRADEGRRLGGAVPQGTLFGSLEKAFSPRGHRPRARGVSPSGTGEALGRRRLGAGVCGTGKGRRNDGRRRRSALSDTGAEDAAVREKRERATPSTGGQRPESQPPQPPNATPLPRRGEARRGTAPVRVSSPERQTREQGAHDEAPDAPRGRGVKGRLPRPYRLDPRAVSTGRPDGAAGTGKRHQRLGLGHLRNDLERSRGTSRRPGEARKAPRRHGPPRRGGGKSRKRETRPKPRRRVSAASGDPWPRQRREAGGGGERGRAGFRTPAFRTTPSGGWERRGARRQSEKTGPIRHECPSLVWRGLGPARESATSPHRSKHNGERPRER